MYLEELWSTMRDQEGDWEWVILHNGKNAIRNYKNAVKVFKDPRIKQVIHKPAKDDVVEKLKIGSLKKYACQNCSGDILIEVDHDDLLAENCFKTLIDVFSDPTVGFAYSDFAEFHDTDGSAQVYGANSGWEVYPVKSRGKNYIAHKAFPPDPRSICQIEFAPNHIRAWRASVYWELGGHADLFAGDDHDLVCRSYLHTKVVHIKECLYFYRRLSNKSNSYLKRYEELHVQDTINRNKYMHKLVEKWCDINNLKKIDLGAAYGKPDGYIGIDILPGATDITHDVTSGLPFEDNSVGVIRAVDFLEHIPDKINIINEIYRVLVPGGWLLSITPSTDGRGAFQDPTHVSYYNENSFLYYTRKTMQDYVNALKCKFQAARLFTAYPSDHHRSMDISYVYADLVAVKAGYRPPGIIEL